MQCSEPVTAARGDWFPVRCEKTPRLVRNPGKFRHIVTIRRRWNPEQLGRVAWGREEEGRFATEARRGGEINRKGAGGDAHAWTNLPELPHPRSASSIPFATASSIASNLSAVNPEADPSQSMCVSFSSRP